MKKKLFKYVGLVIFAILVIVAICNIYTWIVSGKQYIRISTASKAYANSDFYISFVAQEKQVDLETKTNIKLLDSNGKKVKDVNIKYENNSAVISIPDVEAGTYTIEADVSSKLGKDKIKKEIYVSKENNENIVISIDKGIYKPGDTISFRALVTDKENDEPISKDVNVSIFDGNDNRVYNENVKTSDYGILSGKFTLANEVNSGEYKLVVKTETKEATKTLKVNPYITPKYEVKISYDKDNYLVGDTANINLNAKYFFGEAVQDANFTVYINNEEFKEIKSDNQGNASISYEIKNAMTYDVKVEAVDLSNYYVEEKSKFTASTDLFEIKLLPEYGKLASEKNNNVYVMTSKSDGTPIKTYVTISSNNFTKQIATDENGIGKFSIDIDEISNTKYYYDYDYDYDYNYNTQKYSNNTRVFNITAEDVQSKDKVKKEISLDIQKKDLLVTTDKVKYEQGEDIKINIDSLNNNSKNVYFFKDEKLIKMLNTESNETTINLDDTYGLIDIYVVEKGTYYKNSKYKKSIFIKPSKQLNIKINKNKDEYKPGENIEITFNTENENNSSVDAALLVSMVDNSILSMAENDLSIDNIKMALKNIKFSDDMDAETLYSCILDDKSEQTMMALLLKQSDRDVGITEEGMYNNEEEKNACIISVISIIIIGITIITFLCKKFEKFKNFMKHFSNFAIIELVIAQTAILLAEEIEYGSAENNIWWILGITTIVTLASYILWIYKLNKRISRTSISILIFFLVIPILSLMLVNMEMYIGLILLIIALIFLIIVILFRICESKELKISKYVNKVVDEIVYIFKFGCASLISVVIAIALISSGYFIYNIIDMEIIPEIIPELIRIISLPISMISVYLFNAIFNKLGKEPKAKTKGKGKYIILGLSSISIIVFIYILSSILNVSQNIEIDNPIEDTTAVRRSIQVYDDSSATNSGIHSAVPDIASAGNSNESVLDGIKNMFNDSSKKQNIEIAEENNNTNSKEEIERATDDKVRNVFLESMCFIPELITSNGTAKIDFNLSDNITTWTIQTVGNTKDGRIGYGALNDVKVFKDFFVDFELPKNLVETDKVSIPITVYNYTEKSISTTLEVKEEEWFTIENNTFGVNVEAKSTNMVYVPISILKKGKNKFRIEAKGNDLTDIIEKECEVNTKGYKIEKVVSTGNIEKNISEDILVLDDIIENTAKAKVKIYASSIAQTIEGMENIFRMPTGCFEQISSSLYPNILALKYLEDNGIDNENIRNKAISYISSGYQKLLTYEVKGTKGGYSLYGKDPAETVLTAYGLMEITDLSQAYNVDKNVIENMTKYLYQQQNIDGSFKITGNHIGGAGSRNNISMNAYIIWALSESNPNDERIKKSVDYLKNNLKDIDDNYTLALIANVLANVKDKESNNVIKRLINNINYEDDTAYLKSNIVDYYGSRSNVQNIQTVALASMALSKENQNTDKNKLLIKYLIKKKDPMGTWNSTQATILALKALNEFNEKSKLENQTINVKINNNEQKIEVNDNPLELYELTFENLNKENKLNIELQKGSAYYEVVEEYYIPYEKVDKKDDNIEVVVESNKDLKVNEILKSNIKIINKNKTAIQNGMVTISIPQGFSVVEESLMLLEKNGIIEKYENSYTNLNIYLKNIEDNQIIDLGVEFRANYPVDITGLSVRAYDYYNPEVEGKSMPIAIRVIQ